MGVPHGDDCWHRIPLGVRILAIILNFLWILFLLLVISWILIGSTNAEITENIFRAYDCSSPASIIDLGFQQEAEVGGGCLKGQNIIGQVNKTYTILQLETHQKRTGYSCSLSHNRNVRYCGTYSHQTKLPKYSYQGLPLMISVETCQQIYTNKVFIDPLGGKHPVTTSTITIINYHEAGTTTEKAVCEGAEWKAPDGTTVSNAVVDIQVQITIEEERFLSNDEEVRSQRDQRVLPCSDSADGCATATRTYVWQGKRDTCLLARIREVQGLEVRDAEGNQVFMSTDKSMVRLVKKNAASICGRVVFRTNYDHLYLIAYPTEEPFNRQATPESVSTSTYVRNQDDDLYHNTLEVVEQEFQGVLNNDCQRRAQKAKLDFWLQHVDPGLTTWFLGNGTFATTSGEVIYQYHCRPIHVRILPSQHCYRGAPVERLEAHSGANLDIYSGQQLYMEPLTHRLSMIRIPGICATIFTAKYQNIMGNWFTITPDLRAALPPQAAYNIEHYTILGKNKSDPSQGRTYTEEDLHALEAQQTIGIATAALGATLVGQIDSEQFGQGQTYIMPSHLFPHLPDDGGWASQAYAKVVTFLHTWGNPAAISISLYISWQLGRSFIHWVSSFLALRRLHGGNRHQMWYIPCPEIFLLRKYSKANQQRSHRPRSRGQPATDETGPEREFFVKTEDAEQQGQDNPTQAPSLPGR